MRTASLALAVLLAALIVRGAAADAGASALAGKAAVDSKAVEVGKAAPNFRVGTSDGKTLELRELRGQRVLVFFWASW